MVANEGEDAHMQTSNVNDAQTQLSQLIERAKAETFPQQRFGFMAGKICVPADFDDMGDTQISSLFEASY